jgi:hypothetical protein
MFPEVVLVCQESAPCMEMSYKLHGQAAVAPYTLIQEYVQK